MSSQVVETLAEIRARHERSIGVEQRLVEGLVTRLARPATVLTLVVAVVAWVIVNSVLHLEHATPLDPPPFFWLDGALGLFAAVVATLVLTTQHRQQRHAEERAYLDLQINLLAEQKAAKIIQLLEELRRDLPSVRDRVDLEANALETAADPTVVFSTLEETFNESSDSDEDAKP